MSKEIHSEALGETCFLENQPWFIPYSAVYGAAPPFNSLGIVSLEKKRSPD
jgi:hypothetical protein